MSSAWRQWVAWWCCPPGRDLSRAPRHERRKCTKIVRVADVYDGDTFTVVARIDGAWQRRRCRCAGYDAPELRTSNVLERIRAVEARDFLREKLPKGTFTLHLHGLDKYGRWLVTLPSTPLPELMVEAGHGVYYDGGRKPAFDPCLRNS